MMRNPATRIVHYLRLPILILLLFSLSLRIQGEDSQASVSRDNGKTYAAVRNPSVDDRVITRAIVHLLQKGHYSNPRLNDRASQQMFDEYFQHLDPNKVYFIAEDLAEFSPYRLILDDLLRRGDLKFAFQVYERFLQRVEERLAYARERVKEPFDFSKDETMLIDRTELPWAADQAELDAIWNRRIKNQMLIQKLMHEARDRESKPPLQREPTEAVLQNHENYYKLLNNNDTHDVLQLFLTTLTSIYDPHSSYMNWRQLEDFNIDMSLQLQGIGAVLTSDDGYTKIVRIILGGPAKRDGRLKPGYRIISVAQGKDEEPINVVNMPLQKVVRLIRGKKGTQVRLTVIRTMESVPEEIILTRDKVKLKDSAARGETKYLQNKNGAKIPVGYILVPSFYADWEAMRRNDPNARSVTKDVRRLVEKMQQEDKIKGLILDLRGNGGGSLEESISLAGLFVPDGPMVQVKHAAGEPIVRRDDDDSFAFQLPVTVMIDHTSASASEICAGALQDYGRALVFGDRQTHGKGTVQTVLRLNKFEAMRDLKPGALKYTMAKFYRITGHSTQLKGVVPDIALPSFFDHMQIGEEHLPHALPWDEIEPLEYTRTTTDVQRYMPRLKARSAERVRDNKEFQTLFDEIKRYGKRREMNALTLNMEKRNKLRKQDEYWAERTNAVLFRNPEVGDDDDDDDNGEPDEEKKEYNDLYLKEAMAVVVDLADMIEADQQAN